MAQIAFEGRLTADPQIKYGNDGKPRASFTVAENFRQLNRDTQQWEDSGVTFHNVTLFGRHAENPALVKGAVVTIAGTQKSRAYEKDGEKRNWTETTANSFGVVPIQQGQQSSPRPSVQGEGFGPQQGYAAPQQAPSQWGAGTGGGSQWPAAAQPGQGFQQQGGYGQDPVPF